MVAVWYAWRGKGAPVILKATARTEGELRAEIERQLPQAAARFGAQTTAPQDKKFLAGLITRYLAALEGEAFAHLAERTKSDRRKLLGRVTADIGHLELKALESGLALSVLRKWRSGYSATPRTADALLDALSSVLTWAHKNGDIPVQPLVGVDKLYKADRADVIWTAPDLAAVLAESPKELAWAIKLAIHTGARLGDLRALTWAAVEKKGVKWQTGKSRRRRTVIVPLTPELRETLASIEQRNSPNILTSRRGTPWTESGLETALRLAKAKADAKLAKRGEDRRLKPLRWHDMRGTFATYMIASGMTLEDVATMLGWEREKVAEIARRYVTSEAVAVAILDRWRNRKGT